MKDAVRNCTVVFDDDACSYSGANEALVIVLSTTKCKRKHFESDVSSDYVGGYWKFPNIQISQVVWSL